MRRLHNSLIVQKFWRRHRATQVLKSARLIGIWAQTHYRANLGRAICRQLNQDRRALQIQTQTRKYAAMKNFKRIITAVLVIQCSRRSYMSRLLLSLKKAEARDLGAVVQERDRLRNEVSALKSQLQRAKEAPPQSQVFSDVTVEQINEKDTEIKYLRVELQRIKAEKESKENELDGAMQELANLKTAQDAALSKSIELQQLNAGLQELIMASQCSDDEIERLKKENVQLLSEFEELKSLHETLTQENNTMRQSSVSTTAGQSDHLNVPSTPVSSHLSNMPPTPVSAEVEYALEKALARITELEEANEALRKHQTDEKIVAADAGLTPITSSAIDFPSLPVTSVYTTATTDNMTADTDDEVAKLREENQVLQTQLELLRDNQGVVPDIMGSDQEYEESVNPSDSDGYSEEGDESSGFARYVYCL
jgi:myosin heavy subunit